MLALPMLPPAAPGAPRDEASASAGRDELALEAASLRPLLRAVVARVLVRAHDDADGDDCTNEALRRALEGRERLRAGEPLRPWVVGIARHVALDLLRARKRSRPASSLEDDGDTPLVDTVVDAGPNPYERVAQAQRDQAVRDALQTLPDGARRALTMFHLEGRGYQEIAAALGVPLGTVATWISRGRKAMAQVMEKEVERS